MFVEYDLDAGEQDAFPDFVDAFALKYTGMSGLPFDPREETDLYELAETRVRQLSRNLAKQMALIELAGDDPSGRSKIAGYCAEMAALVTCYIRSTTKS